MESKFEIVVEAATPAESQRLAQELGDSLRFSDPNVTISRKKDSAETLDLGATIAVIVGSAAAGAIANGIRVWLAKRQTAKITISKDGEVSGSGLTSADAVRITEIVTGLK